MSAVTEIQVRVRKSRWLERALRCKAERGSSYDELRDYALRHISISCGRGWSRLA